MKITFDNRPAPDISGIINIPNDCTIITVNAFEGIRAKEIIVSKNVIIDSFAFCGSYIDKIILKGNNELRKSSFEKSSAKEIVLPNDIDVIPRECFYNCRNLEKINIPQSVDIIGPEAFSACYKLKHLDLPQEMKIIKHDAFSYSGIESITIPEGVAKLEDYSFLSCKNLKEVKLPSTLKIIGDSAFEECISLENLNLPSNLTLIDAAAFANTKIRFLIVPDSLECVKSNSFHKMPNDFKICMSDKLYESPIFSWLSDSHKTTTLPLDYLLSSGKSLSEINNLLTQGQEID